MKISIFPFEVVITVMQNLRNDVQDKNASTNFVDSCLFKICVMLLYWDRKNTPP